jgi:hypothetical protein
MKIATFAFLMVIVLTLVESYSKGDGRRRKGGGWGDRGGGPPRSGIDIVDGLRLKRDLNNKLVQRDLGNGQRRFIRDVNKKHHVHMSYERIPAARVPRNAQPLKNVHETAFAETEDG